jgi:hypothetical protein
MIADLIPTTTRNESDYQPADLVAIERAIRLVFRRRARANEHRSGKLLLRRASATASFSVHALAAMLK